MTDLFKNYPELLPSASEIEKAVCAVTECALRGGKILICGNGGSSADAEHISGELTKGFLSLRPMSGEVADKFAGLPDGDRLIKSLQCGIQAIPLPSLTALSTAYANDADPTVTFAQGVFTFGKPGDVLIGISTSGNSENVMLALETARAIGVMSIALVGGKRCRADDIADIVIKAPSDQTYRIQEYHLPIYHYICAEVEKRVFG